MKSLTAFIILSILSISAHAFTFDIEYVDASESEISRFEMARKRVEEIVHSEEFKDKVVRFNNYSCFNSANFPSGVKNIQDVLNHIEIVRAPIKIKFFSGSPRVLGSTSGNTISFNSNNFTNRKDQEIANTLFHEGLHTIGYGHCGKNNIRLFPKIKRSIPYKLGDFVEELY